MNMEKQITLHRTYEAPLEKVWNAWTNPEELTQWWGPDNVTIPDTTLDLQVGGHFRITMEASEAMGSFKGAKWPMDAVYTVVEPLAHLLYDAQAWTEGLKEDTIINQSTEVFFTEDTGKTTIEVQAAILKTGPKAGIAVQGMEMGFTQQLEKLAVYLQR